MYESILQFAKKSIKELEKIVGEILTGEADSDDLSTAIHERVLSLGRGTYRKKFMRNLMMRYGSASAAGKYGI